MDIQLICATALMFNTLNMNLEGLLHYTRWFKYDRDWFVQTYTQISPGHIWTTLYIKCPYITWEWKSRLSSISQHK